MKKQLLGYQRCEITEHYIYRRLARIQKSPENRKILGRIAEDEKMHYYQWKSYTGEEALVDWSKVRRFYSITRIFGLTFGTRLMERGEAGAQKEYSGLHAEIDQAKTKVSALQV